MPRRLSATRVTGHEPRSGFAVALQTADRDGANAVDAKQLQDDPHGTWFRP